MGSLLFPIAFFESDPVFYSRDDVNANGSARICGPRGSKAVIAVIEISKSQ